MSYIDFIEKAASKMFDSLATTDAPIMQVQLQLDRAWMALEKFAKSEHYEVLECSNRLRELCNNVGALLYLVPSSVPADCQMLRVKDAEYGGSWQRRGGPGAFFAACRKWDRYEESLKRHGSLGRALEEDQRAEGILDDIGDLRRYLILWEAWRLAKEQAAGIAFANSRPDHGGGMAGHDDD